MITKRVTYVASAALIGFLAAGIPTTIWFESENREPGLHGPVGLIVALPFAAIFALGSIILGVLVIRARMATIPTAIGLLPLFILLLGGASLFILVASVA